VVLALLVVVVVVVLVVLAVLVVLVVLMLVLLVLVLLTMLVVLLVILLVLLVMAVGLLLPKMLIMVLLLLVLLLLVLLLLALLSLLVPLLLLGRSYASCSSSPMHHVIRCCISICRCHASCALPLLRPPMPAVPQGCSLWATHLILQTRDICCAPQRSVAASINTHIYVSIVVSISLPVQLGSPIAILPILPITPVVPIKLRPLCYKVCLRPAIQKLAPALLHPVLHVQQTSFC
jgi:hypothetical protein